MRKRLDISPHPDYQKSLEGIFLGAFFSNVGCLASLFIAAKYNLIPGYVTALILFMTTLGIFRGVFINFNNKILELETTKQNFDSLKLNFDSTSSQLESTKKSLDSIERKIELKSKYIKHDSVLFDEVKSYLDFDQMQIIKNTDFAGTHDSEDFAKISKYLYYFSKDINKNFLNPEIIPFANDLLQSSKDFMAKFNLYNSANSKLSRDGVIKLDISKSLRDGSQAERERYYREVNELNDLADKLYESYKLFIDKATPILASE